ncbi:unnamed protein product [Pieris macdunnoughi]|uniref:General transcription factor II-I repeat domain-containing protein 2 n=1 Tax=Pieris macdunnoughi TaxID=345717 RepID=A0A821UFS2_9NEOP|nr:unnamed protein product [Pieris macdunnoughi]
MTKHNNATYEKMTEEERKQKSGALRKQISDIFSHINKLNLKLQGRNQLIHDTWGHIRGFKLQLNLFSKQLLKKDFTHFPRLKSIAVTEDKVKSYEKHVKCLHEEYERRFQDFKVIEQDLEIFSMPFNLDCESVKPELQLELIELQCNTELKQLFLNVSKIEFYKALALKNNFSKPEISRLEDNFDVFLFLHLGTAHLSFYQIMTNF